MENNILIIGNGFDLYHKLPTRYKDFLLFANHWNEFKEEYDRQTDLTGILLDEADQIDVRLGQNGELVPESLSDMATHGLFYCNEHIQYLDEHLQNNAWIVYFNKINPLGTNWIDFEAEIERALMRIELYYTEFLPTREVGDMPMKEMPDPLKDTVLTFGDLLERRGTGYQNIARRATHSSKDLDHEILRANKLRLLAFMKEELDVLNHCLNYYLEFVSAMRSNVYSEQIRALKNVHLLNFNYTYTYANVYGKRLVINHHPIHGEIKEGNLVLGISDESFDENLDYVYFQKYFQRIQKRTGSFYKDWIKKRLVSADNDSEPKVYIMGHSLGKTDKGVLEDFFLAENIKKITIFYHDQTAYENQVINLVDMFGKDFVIDQTGRQRIIFEKLKLAVCR